MTSYMSAVIIYLHMRADSTGECDIFPSNLHVTAPAFSYRAFAPKAELIELIYASVLVSPRFVETMSHY